VVNRQNENLGKIHELVIDAKDDRLVYVVLPIGDFLDMVNKLFAMFWKPFEFHAPEHKLILNLRFVLEPVQTLFRNRLRHFRKLCHSSEGA